MDWMTYVFIACGVIILAATVVSTYRLLSGPNTLDRLVAVDMLVAVAICGLCVWVAYSQDTTVTSAIVSLALLNFIGSVSVVRYRVRDTE
jgi:multicomponent Na+:H+ antiporter subunit F